MVTGIKGKEKCQGQISWGQQHRWSVGRITARGGDEAGQRAGRSVPWHPGEQRPVH